MKRILFAALTAAALFSGGILQSLNAQNMEIPKKVSPFPVGDKLPEQFSKYFVGQAWLAPLTDDKRLNAPVSNVTFSPGCRNNWHSHTGGQLPDSRRGPGLLSGEGPSGPGVASGRHRGDRARRGPLARRGSRQLVLASGRRVQSRDQREHMARTGRRRAICGSDGFRPGSGLPPGRRRPTPPGRIVSGRNTGTWGCGPRII